MNEKVFARHLSYHHAILNPDEELSNKDNREIIWNPPKLPKMDNETRRFLLFEQRRALGKDYGTGLGWMDQDFGNDKVLGCIVGQ